MTAPRIGYIGLGVMGGALARRLLREHKLTVFDLSKERCAEFAALGATVAASPAEVGAASDIVLTCLPTSAQVRAVIFGDNDGLIRGMKPGGLIADQTSGATAATRAMAEELAPTGVQLIDAPVSGGPRGADAGTIAIMVGGEPAQYARLEPVLKVISPNVAHVGPLGAGHTLKSSSRDFGAPVLSQLGYELEIMGKDRTRSGAENVLAQVETHFPKIKIALEEIRDGGLK